MRNADFGLRNKKQKSAESESEIIIKKRQYEDYAVDVKDIKPDDVLDCVGLSCPMPIFKTSNRIKELKPGQVLEVQADDDGIEKDMPAWCRMTGNEFLGIIKENEEYRVFVRKS